MNETRGNARTKQMKRGDLRGEKNSLKDSEKTNDVFNKTFQIIRLIYSSLFLITLIIYGFINKKYDLLICLGLGLGISIPVIVFFWAYTKAISKKF